MKLDIETKKDLSFSSVELEKYFNEEILRTAGQVVDYAKLSIKALQFCILLKFDDEDFILDKYNQELFNKYLNKHHFEIDKQIQLQKNLIWEYFKDCKKTSQSYISIHSENTFNDDEIYTYMKSLLGGAYSGGKNVIKNSLKNFIMANDEDSYHSSVFLDPISHKRIPFDKGTINYICARPSAGKTTALISIALDVLRQNEKLKELQNRKKKVLFLTAEEPTEHIVIKLILNEFYYLCDKANERKIIKEYSRETIKEKLKYYYKDLSPDQQRDIINLGEKKSGTDNERILYYLWKSAETINDYAESGLLEIVEVTRLDGLKELEDILKEQSEGTVILLDYIQKLVSCCLPEYALRYDDFKQIQTISNCFMVNCRDNKLIGIAGAQLNRDSENEDVQDLTMKCLRGSGDLEQDAFTIIGMGRNKSKNFRYYNVAKARNFEYNEKAYCVLNDQYKFAYVKTLYEIGENNTLKLFSPADYNPDSKK